MMWMGHCNLAMSGCLARFATFLLPLCVVWLHAKKDSERDQAGVNLIDMFPKLVGTGCMIATKFEKPSTLTSIALRNAQLSHRGSLRKAHCAIQWVGSRAQVMFTLFVDCDWILLFSICQPVPAGGSAGMCQHMYASGICITTKYI